MKANFKREVKRNKNKHKIRRETRENGPLLSWVVDPPGTKGEPRAGNFPGPPKTPFVPGGGFTRDKRPPIYFVTPSPFPLTLGFSSAPGAAAITCSDPPTARAQRPRAPPPSTSPPRAPPREPNVPERRRPHAAAQSPAASSGSPRRRLCAPSPYVRHAPPWPCHCSTQPAPP